MNKPIETRLLHYFLAVADEQHIGRAAARLHISQPPLSRQMHDLERRIGVDLFRRDGRGIALTTAGVAFRADAARVLDALADAERQARRVADGVRGRLRLAFVSTTLYNLLPRLVRAFRGEHPEVHIELLERTADAQLEAFARGSIDIGLMLCASPTDGIELIPMLEEPLVVCMPDTSPAASTETIDVVALRDEPFVMVRRELAPGLYDRIVGFAERAGFALRIGQQAVQMQTVIGLVSAGVGVALVPRSMRGLARPGVVYRDLSPNPPVVETQLAWRKDSDNPVSHRFVHHARNAGIADRALSEGPTG